MNEDTKQSFWSGCAGVSPNDRRNQRRIMGASLAWAVTYVGATWLLKGGQVQEPLSWVVASLPVLFGLAVIAVYRRFLRETDELQRIVQLEALALAFGGSVFAFCGYSVFQRLGAPSIDMADSVVVMVFLYISGVVMGWRRYR